MMAPWLPGPRSRTTLQRPRAPGIAGWAWLVTLGAAGGALTEGCSGSHNQLGNDDTTSSVTTSGTGGAGGDATTSSSTGGAGTGGVDAGPPGPTELTIVNGVADYDAIRICFVPYPEGPGGFPWPSAPTGLAFAGAQVIDRIDQVITSDVDVRPHVLAGDLAETAGKSCDEILALNEPALVVAPLAVLPASVFTSGKSVLLVPTGCLGGPGHTDPGEVLGCGLNYTEDTPTAGLVALGMSRQTDQGSVSFQVVHASAPMPVVDVGITPGFDAAPESKLAYMLSPGAIDPQPPFAGLNFAELGILSQVKLKTYAPGDTYPTSAVLFQSVFANDGLGESDIVNGEGLVLVAVGGHPGVPAGPWWNAHTYVMVRADPD